MIELFTPIFLFLHIQSSIHTHTHTHTHTLNQKIIIQNIMTKKVRGVSVRLKRNKPERCGLMLHGGETKA